MTITINVEFFVTRTKKNTVIRPVELFKPPDDASVLTDEMVYVGTPLKQMENILRLIDTVDSEGKPVAILTYRFDLDADEIGQIYRERWACSSFSHMVTRKTKFISRKNDTYEVEI